MPQGRSLGSSPLRGAPAGMGRMPKGSATPAQGKARARPRGTGQAGNGVTRASSSAGTDSLVPSLPEVEHAELLAAQRFGPPGGNGQQIRFLRGLQRRYGNDQVAHVLALVREASPPAGENAGGRSAASRLSVQLQAATACPAPPQAPVSTPPDQDPKFQAVESKIRKDSAGLKKHPPANAKAAEAQP